MRYNGTQGSNLDCYNGTLSLIPLCNLDPAPHAIISYRTADHAINNFLWANKRFVNGCHVEIHGVCCMANTAQVVPLICPYT